MAGALPPSDNQHLCVLHAPLSLWRPCGWARRIGPASKPDKSTVSAGAGLPAGGIAVACRPGFASSSCLSKFAVYPCRRAAGGAGRSTCCSQPVLVHSRLVDQPAGVAAGRDWPDDQLAGVLPAACSFAHKVPKQGLHASVVCMHAGLSIQQPTPALGRRSAI